MFNNQRLLHMLRQTGFLFPLVVLFGVMSGALVILQSLELSKIISSVFLDGQTLTEVSGLLRLFLLVIILRVLFTILNDTFAAAMAVKVKTNLRDLIMQKIDRLGPAYTHTQQSGELVTTAMQGIEALDAYFSQYMPQVLLAAILPLIILMVVFPLDWVSGLVFLVTTPLIPFFMALIGKASEAETKKQWKALSRLGADFLDTLQGLTTLKLLGKSKAQIKRVEEVSERYRVATLNVLRITFLSALVLELLATISTAVVAVEVGLRLLYGQLIFQQAFFVLLLAPEFYQPMRNLGMRYHAGMTGVTAAVRIFQLLDEPEPTQVQKVESDLPVLDLHSPFRLSFEHISFAYPQNLNDSLKAIQLNLESGKTYSLVGHSGAGKSTLLKLLMRFIEPSEGSILFNGVDLRCYSVVEWRKQISWVSQKPMLFNTSILENIRLEDSSISETQVWQALEQAQLADFVLRLPERLQTPLGEWGARFSGGQGQRIALARAFLKNAPLILMDEPTAALDPELEEALVKSMQTLVKQHTLITIAHRISTIQQSDEVIVMEDGRVVEVDSPAALLKRKGTYASFYQIGEANA
jgi:ATP-binding cassette subfamily C protein CydD